MAVLDVLTMGRVEVGIYPLHSGSGLPDVTSFGKYLGGGRAYVALAAARHGRRSAAITRTDDDPFGTFVRRAPEPAAAPAVRRGSALRARPSARP